MLWFKKKKSDNNQIDNNIESNVDNSLDNSLDNNLDKKLDKSSEKGFFSNLKSGLSKTREKFTKSIAVSIFGKKIIDEELLEDIESHLLLADIGVSATNQIIEDVKKRIAFKELNDVQALWETIKHSLNDILLPCDVKLDISKLGKKPFVILMVGVNGTGKTTTIGKLAHKFQKEGKSVMLAAGDTFRAAAVEQLKSWGDRNNIPLIAQSTGADSSAVMYDAIQSACAKDVDVLIADTAGRLHTQKNLMQELEKIKRVLNKVMPDAPHETMIVLDAGIGQNALVQAEEFNKAMKLTGITITKLDGTAKGGMVFAIAKKLKLPIRYIGVGEGIEDLQEFHAHEFVDALVAE